MGLSLSGYAAAGIASLLTAQERPGWPSRAIPSPIESRWKPGPRRGIPGSRDGRMSISVYRTMTERARYSRSRQLAEASFGIRARQAEASRPSPFRREAAMRGPPPDPGRRRAAASGIPPWSRRGSRPSAGADRTATSGGAYARADRRAGSSLRSQQTLSRRSRSRVGSGGPAGGWNAAEDSRARPLRSGAAPRSSIALPSHLPGVSLTLVLELPGDV